MNGARLTLTSNDPNRYHYDNPKTRIYAHITRPNRATPYTVLVRRYNLVNGRAVTETLVETTAVNIPEARRIIAAHI